MEIGGACTPSRRGTRNCTGANAGMGKTVMAVIAITGCDWMSSRADFSGGIDTDALSQKSWQFALDRFPRCAGASVLCDGRPALAA